MPTAAILADPDIPLIDSQATQDDAIHMLLEGNHERLVVVDSAGLLVGLLSRHSLLRALAQASAG